MTTTPTPPPITACLLRVGAAVDHAIPPAVDRALRRDHSLCGAHPCSDCR